MTKVKREWEKGENETKSEIKRQKRDRANEGKTLHHQMWNFLKVHLPRLTQFLKKSWQFFFFKFQSSFLFDKKKLTYSSILAPWRLQGMKRIDGVYVTFDIHLLLTHTVRFLQTQYDSAKLHFLVVIPNDGTTARNLKYGLEQLRIRSNKEAHYSILFGSFFYIYFKCKWQMLGYPRWICNTRGFYIRWMLISLSAHME